MISSTPKKWLGSLRGGMVPPASVSPAARCATRDLLRRRRPLMRNRAERLPHVQQTNGQYPWPTSAKRSRTKPTAPVWAGAVSYARCTEEPRSRPRLDRLLGSAAAGPGVGHGPDGPAACCPHPVLAPDCPWPRHAPASRALVCNPCQCSLPAGAGLRVLLPACAMGQASAGNRYGTSGTKIGTA